MRISRQDARRRARHFPRGRGRAWPWVGDQDAIIDAEVMDVVREAWSADSAKSVTAEELLAFRTMLVEELAKKGFRP